MGQRVHGATTKANHPACGRIAGFARSLVASLGASGIVLSAVAQTPAPAPGTTLRVGTSGDYAPFSTAGRDAGAAWQPGGLDPAVARAYAADRGLQIEWVRFRWPELLDDLATGRFDVAMSGVTVRPERSIAGRFSVPVAQAGAVVLISASAPSTLDALDAPAVTIGVNAGGHLEQVARKRFPKASIHAIPDNQGVRAALWAGTLDAAVSDTLEAPHWLEGSRGLRALQPFTRDRKAYLLPPDSSARASDLDRWLLSREADGTLAKLRREHLGGIPADRRSDGPAPAVAALLAAIDERLSLMPDVARSKLRSGAPVEVKTREAAVLAAAVAATQHAAADQPDHRPDDPGVDTEAVQGLFRALIEASKEIQAGIVGTEEVPAAGAPLPDLATALRPAVMRIGERIAFLIVRLDRALDPAKTAAATREALSEHGLADETIAAIADAIVAVSDAGAAATQGQGKPAPAARGPVALQ